MMEEYFSQPHEVKMLDTRPETSYQASVRTPLPALPSPVVPPPRRPTDLSASLRAFYRLAKTANAACAERRSKAAAPRAFSVRREQKLTVREATD